MTYSDEIQLSTKGFCDVHNITDEVQDIVSKSGIKEGIVCVSCVGSTVGITTLEYEPNLVQDFCELMENLIPHNKPTRHGNTWGDDNGFSHLRSALIGTSASFPVSGGRLVLGTWQQIVFCDFDNRERTRKIYVKVVGEKRE